MDINKKYIDLLDEISRPSVSRRDFLKKIARGAGAWCTLSVLGGTLGNLILAPGDVAAQDEAQTLSGDKGVKGPDEQFVKAARYRESLKEKKVLCKLCPKECEVANLERGYCGVRENRNGEYKTLVYGRVCSLNDDPIEKKPLFHFLPGTKAFSLSTAGCNFDCKYCQNWQISQFRPEQVRARYLDPTLVPTLARRTSCKSVAYTYGEPVIFYEYMYDSATAARKTGIRNVVITNGYFQEEPLRELCSVVDAIKVDFKGFSQKFYEEVCDGELEPVLRNLKIMKEQGVWLELVILIIPTKNDSPEEIKKMSTWVVENLGADVPMHFSRFHPQYKLKNLPPTPVKTLERCCEIAKENGVNYTYLGNVPGHKLENTYCPKCNELLIRRTGFFVRKPDIKDGKCPNCGEPIAGIWA